MKFSFSPIRMDTLLEVTLVDETLTVNGESYDLSTVEEGQVFEDHGCPWIIGPVLRSGGELEALLLLPHGGNPPHETMFPQQVQLTSGPVPLPAYDTPETDEHLE